MKNFIWYIFSCLNWDLMLCEVTVLCLIWFGVCSYSLYQLILWRPRKPPDKKNDRSSSVRFLSIMVFPVTLGIFPRTFRLNLDFYFMLAMLMHWNTSSMSPLTLLVVNMLTLVPKLFVMSTNRKPPDILPSKFFKWFAKNFSTNSICGWMASMDKSNVSLLSVITSSSVTLTFDTGATKACTPNKSEFINFRKTSGKNIGGIANDLSIEGEGTVKYLVYASNGTPITLQVEAYYVPSLSSSTRLISPQDIGTDTGKDGLVVFPRRGSKIETATLYIVNPSFDGNLATLSSHTNVSLSYNPSNCLPELSAQVPNYCNLALHACKNVADDVNANLNVHQKELLK